jgi:hypothetical protein
MNTPLIIAAQIEGIATRKDGTLLLRFGTQELSPEKMADVFGLKNGMCYLAIKVEDFGQDELEKLEGLEAELTTPGKTFSKRLRDVLFRYWELDNQGYKDFAGFYLAKMEGIIGHYKGKLP